MITVGFDWLKDIVVDDVPVPTLALMIPQELMSDEQTVIEDEPVVLAVVRVIVEPEMLVCMRALFWLAVVAKLCSVK